MFWVRDRPSVDFPTVRSLVNGPMSIGPQMSTDVEQLHGRGRKRGSIQQVWFRIQMHRPQWTDGRDLDVYGYDKENAHALNFIESRYN